MMADMKKKTVVTHPRKMSNNKCQIMDTPTATTEEVSKKSGMMEYLVMRCTNCSENYGEDRIPRSLACGHAMCTPCVEKCLASQKICPECQEKQLANSITDLPVNFPLLGLIRSVTSDEVDINSIIIPTFPVDIVCSDQWKDIWNCGAHGNPMLFFCSSCSIWVCQDCLVIDHPCLPRGSCRILGLTDAMIQIKNKHEKTANQTLKDIENIKRSFKFETAMHSFCLKHCPNDLRSHSYLLQQVESQLEELGQINDSVVEHAKERLRKSVDSANTTSPEEITSSCKELLDCQRVLEEDISKEKESLTPVLQIMEEHLRLDLKMLVAGQEPVYAVFNEDKGSKWAPICIRENRLLLYCLNEGKLPKKGITIPFEYVKKLLPKRGKIIFFEVGTEEEDLGRVYVRFGDNNPLNEQFILLCSGEKGVSYRKTSFYNYDKKHGLLKGGDYENNDGSGGKPIVKGLAEGYTGSVYGKLTGALVVERASTRFHFHLKYLSESIDYNGWITRGLNVVTSLAKMEPVAKSIIRDCGLFIPMKLEKSEDTQ